jgi:hypothetical protein
MSIGGHVERGLEPIAEAFERNFTERSAALLRALFQAVS